MRLLLSLLMLVAGAAGAHEIRPVYLQLDERAPGRIEVLLKLPVFRDSGLAAAYPVFPDSCVESARAPLRHGDETAISTWQLSCDAPLTDQTVRIEGFSPLAPDALLRVRLLDGTEAHYILSAAQPSVRISAAQHGTATPGLAAYLPIGVEHILLGIDHLLFVLGLMLLVWRAGSGPAVLLATVTAFTIAHSITLALAVLRGVSLPGATVETLIALSILMLAVELARSLGNPAEKPQGLTFRKPWLVAFVFGLLHGFGFAGALQETGLPVDARAWALLLFNVGVELGQLLFVTIVYVAYRLASAALRVPLPALARVVSWMLGVTSAAWVLDRIQAVFTV